MEFKDFSNRKTESAREHNELNNYFDDLVFKKNTINFGQMYSGRAWLIELFMHSQANSKKLNRIAVLLNVLICSFTFLTVSIIHGDFEKELHWTTRMRLSIFSPDLPLAFNIYNLVLIFLTTVV